MILSDGVHEEAVIASTEHDILQAFCFLKVISPTCYRFSLTGMSFMRIKSHFTYRHFNRCGKQNDSVTLSTYQTVPKCPCFIRKTNTNGSSGIFKTCSFAARYHLQNKNDNSNKCIYKCILKLQNWVELRVIHLEKKL